MDNRDVDKLFRLLEQYYPNSKQVKNPDTKLAWALALERYPYNEIRAAVIQYSAENKYFPDIADLTSRCAGRERTVVQDRSVKPYMDQEIREFQQMEPALKEMDRLMELDYTAGGVPHPSDARKMGWSVEDWVRECRAWEANQ